MSNQHQYYLGLDLGSVTVKLALLDESQEPVWQKYMRHQARPLETTLEGLKELFSIYQAEEIKGASATGTGGKLLAQILGLKFINEVIAQAKATVKFHPEVKSVIEIGGQDATLIVLNTKKELVNGNGLEDFSMNNSCAAGTGSFLDQQASRLGVSIEEEFSRLALKSTHPPRLAGRCSVFAKSDMIHLQQIGTPDYDIMAGLCYAFARTFKSDIARGKKLAKPIAFQGGVGANQALVKAFREVFELKENELIVPKYFSIMGAIGAVLILMENGPLKDCSIDWLDAIENYLSNRPPLRSSMKPLNSDRQIERETRATLDLKPAKLNEEKSDAYLGIDVGSLSTNVVAIDKEKNVIVWRYLKTAGRPIEAVRRGLKEIGQEVGERLQVLGVGTTGSGRYLTGDFVGADVVKNEITSQATAAINIDPTVDTIFEIGGQDSKYISIDQGVVVDFEMNKACAAGTGSFLEEQAEKVGLKIEEEFGQIALAAKCPGCFGDRCTVFMESDLVCHQQRGTTKDNLVAGLAYSVVLNYLNKVVGDRKIGNNIFFQGGVAFNQAVIGAFEKILGKNITVPPYHHITGAIGVAILAMENTTGVPSKFKGFDLSKRTHKASSFTCKGCANYCEIRKIEFEGDARAVYYGTRCEKYEIDEKKREKGKKLPDLYKEREKALLAGYEAEKTNVRTNKARIGLPRILLFYEFFPYWSSFFKELGLEIILSSPTTPEIIHNSVESVTADTCFPIKIVHGHVEDLAKQGLDYIFLPSLIHTKRTNPKYELNYCCPLVQAAPYITPSALELAKKDIKLIKTPLNFQRGSRHIKSELQKLGKELGATNTQIEKAIIGAEKAQGDFYGFVHKRGKEILNWLEENKGIKAVVILSRPYNGCDPAMNLGLPQKLKDMGILAIPIDFLPLEEIDIYGDYPDMYWKYGQQTISATKFVKEYPRLHAIYISNFKCGPDSFIAHFVRDEMGKKPYLELEIDEHSADAGVVTRCEAFFDSIENQKRVGWKGRLRVRDEKPSVITKEEGKRRTVYVPYMSDHAHAFSAAFRGCGIRSEVLPASDDRTLELGRKFSSGKECFPFIVTTGDFLRKAQEADFKPKKSAFFMPAANGPCRFGQYHKLQRIILDDLGFNDVLLVSPNSKNAYKDFGDVGNKFQRLAWRGILATDFLQKLIWEIRSYEKIKGQSDEAYKRSLALTCGTLERGESKTWRLIEQIKEIFSHVEFDRQERKPIIGIVGEIFIRNNCFSNEDIVRQVESLGGEAWVAPVSEWILYINHRFVEDSIFYRRYQNLLPGLIKKEILRHDEHIFTQAFYGNGVSLLNLKEPNTKTLLDHSVPYLHHSFGGEAILSIGKAIDFMKKGVSGIINVMPFTCMPGMVVQALSRRFREENENIPWLNIFYDGQKETNTFTRLEAFMYQATQFNKERKIKEPHSFYSSSGQLRQV